MKVEMHAESIPWYWRALDFEKLARDFPPPPDYFRTTFRMSRDELRALQEQRFLQTMRRGWEIAFFQRHWRDAGMEPGDIRGLDDLGKVPPYDVHHIRDSIERNPPFGDFMGISPSDGKRMPLVLQTSGGTTGLPRPMLYAPQDRETMAIMGGRRFALHGMRPGDLVLVTYALGLSNGAFAPREAMWHYCGAVPVMTGGGATTPTRRQIEIAKAWGVNVILGFPSYLRHMALVARDEMKIDPRSLGIRLIGTHLGMEDRRKIEDLWGAPCFDAYGTHESGMMAAECQHQSGMHVQEDAFILEIADPESGKILPEGGKGTIYITTLYKYGAPQIRFNVNDSSAFVPGTCPCGGTLRRLDRIFGRNDNMVKLRGVNVFPEAVGAVVAEDSRTNGEFFCFVDRVGEADSDEMTVMVEVTDPAADRAAVKADLERRMKEVLGVRVTVGPTAKGALDPYTGISQTSKIKRLLDRRKQSR
ncbi:MAG: phenylacetate--CoA ligase family protein [Betaproteobacteria bacterium]|nr:phenylacetate--CoA ligase family protein [Betaproteobacteria bacterium]